MIVYHLPMDHEMCAAILKYNQLLLAARCQLFMDLEHVRVHGKTRLNAKYELATQSESTSP